MQLTSKEFWTALHGIVFGAGFLLAFAGGWTGLWGLRREWVTEAGTRRIVQQLMVWTWSMAILAWLTVIIGTWIIYPWYRAKPPSNAPAAALADYPKAVLLSDAKTSDWHNFGMEWKEHIAWFSPILATTVAFVVMQYGRQIARDPKVRRALLVLYMVSFFCAAVAGVFGAFINKMAPTR
jgi:hypothetical protein